MIGIEWGTAGEWFSGVGGFLAVGVAVWFGRTEHRRAQHAQALAKGEQARARRAERRMLHAERRAKASRIWIEATGCRAQHDGLSTRWCAEVHNVGENMFHDVYAIAGWSNGASECVVRLGDVPPATVPHRVDVEQDGPEELGRPNWRIEYTDVYGLRWSHSATGELTQHEDVDVQL